MKNLYKCSILLSVLFLTSCSENNSKSKSEDKKNISDNRSTSKSACLQIVTEEKEFTELLTESEYIIFNKKLFQLNEISSENIYKKFDAAYEVLNYLNTLEINNKNIKNNDYFIKTKKSLLNEIYNYKNEISFEAHYYSNKFKESFQKLNLHEDLVPLLSTVNKSKKSIEVYNKKFKTRTNFSINDNNELKNINSFVDLIEFHSSSFYSKMKNDSDLHLMHPTIGLSHAYLIKNIIDFFDNDEDIKINSTLNNIIKIQIYTNLVQLTSDVIDSGIKISHVIKMINNNEMQAIKPFQTFSKISTGINVGLSLFNVVFDAFEVGYSENNSDLIKYKTQLSFDTTSVILSGSGAILGETTAGIFLGGLGVVFGGLTVGFTGFAEASAHVIDQTLSYGKYFLDYKKNHDLILSKNNFYPDKNETMISLAHKNFEKKDEEIKSDHLDIVVEELDFTKNNSYKITFGDHLSPPIKEYSDIRELEFDYNSKDYIKIRESFGSYYKQNKYVEFPLNNIDKIILPNQAQYVITYKHMFVPGITSRYDAELLAARNIEENSNNKFIFDYFPLFGGEKSIGNLKLSEKETEIKIKLSSESKDLYFLTPKIPQFSKNKIKYKFNVIDDKSNSINSYHVHLSGGAKYELELLKSDEWHMHIDEKLKNVNFNENNKMLNIQYENKEYSIHFSKIKPSEIYIHDPTGVVYIFKDNKILPSNINPVLDAKKFTNQELFDTIEKYFNNLEYSLKYKNRYLKINNFQENPNSEIQTIFYDSEKREYIYSHINNNEIEVIGKINNSYVFKLKDSNTLVYKTKEEILYIKYDSYYANNKFYIRKTFPNNYTLYELNEKGLHLIETKYNELSNSVEANLYLNKNHNKYCDLKYHFGPFGLSTAYKINNTIKFIADINLVKTNISDLVRITNDIQGNETKFYYLPLKKEIIHVKEIIDSFLIGNIKYYFTSSDNLSKIIKITDNKEVEIKTYNFSIHKASYDNGSFYIESKKGYIYKLNSQKELSLIALSKTWTQNKLGKSLFKSLNAINTNSKIIKIIISDNESAEYFVDKNKLIISKNNKIYLGESKHHHDRYYFHDSNLNKNFYINDHSYFNAKNYTIVKTNQTITLKYKNQNPEWNEENTENDIIIHNIDKNKKMAFFINHLFK